MLQILIRREQPHVVCSTYPIYSFLLERLARTGRLAAPFYNVVTDSISINSLWTRPACAGWFVPNEETASVMRGMACPRPAARARLPGPGLLSGPRPRTFPARFGFRSDATRLYIVHSGVRNARAIARRLLAKQIGNWPLRWGATNNCAGALSRSPPAAHAPCKFSVGPMRFHGC